MKFVKKVFTCRLRRCQHGSLPSSRRCLRRARTDSSSRGSFRPAAFLACTARQVKRWKEKHALRQQWRASDDDLDAVVQQLHDGDELGALEGYRWVTPVVNEAIPGNLRVGKERVRLALRRTDMDGVKERSSILKKRSSIPTDRGLGARRLGAAPRPRRPSQAADTSGPRADVAGRA